jgi:hypothetical protein
MNRPYVRVVSFILHPFNWYSRRDSNPHCTDLESVVSCHLDYASKARMKDEGGRMNQTPCVTCFSVSSFILPTSSFHVLVPAEGFEPTLSSS